jgi:hypothetical protein
MAPARNNRIMGGDSVNRSSSFDASLESILLARPLKIVFQQYRSQPVSLALKPARGWEAAGADGSHAGAAGRQQEDD